MINIKKLVLLNLIFLSGCSSYADPGGKLSWFVFGFPILGICFFIYQWLFGSKDDDRKK